MRSRERAGCCQAPALPSGTRELTFMAGFLVAEGQLLLFLFPAWSGDPARGQDVVAALQRLGTPVMARVAPMPYSGVLGMFDASVVNGRHYALATRWLPALTDDAAAVLAAAASTATSPLSVIAVHHSTAPQRASPPVTPPSRCAATTCWSRSSPPGSHPPTMTAPPTGPGPRPCPGNSPLRAARRLRQPARTRRARPHPARLRRQCAPAPRPKTPLRPRRRIQHATGTPPATTT